MSSKQNRSLRRNSRQCHETYHAWSDLRFQVIRRSTIWIFMGKSSQHSLDRSQPPRKKKKNRMQSSPLNQDDDIRSKQLGYIGNPNYYSRLIWVTGHPVSGVSNQHPKSNLKTHKLRPHQGFRGEFCPLEMFKSGTNPTHLRWPHLHLAGPADVRHGWRLVLHADMPCCDLLE